MGLNLLWLHNRFKKTHIRSPTEFVAEMQFDVFEIRKLEANGKGQKKGQFMQSSNIRQSIFVCIIFLDSILVDVGRMYK